MILVHLILWKKKQKATFNLNEYKNFINHQSNLDTLRFLTCGSVDDGKSTLIGRIMYESQVLYDDQIDSLTKPK